MRQIKRQSGLVLALCVAFILGLMMDHQPVQAEQVAYSVMPIYPANQTDADLGYYDLKVTPGHRQELELSIQNSSTRPIIVDVTPTTATTNTNGVIDYTGTKSQRDYSLKASFTDLISSPQQVKVPANGSQTITFNLKTPDEPFRGQILGGFYITQVPNNQADQAIKRKGGATLTNRYAYVLAAKLTESDEIVRPSLRLRKIRAGLVNSHPTILVNIQNFKANAVGKMKVRAEIRKVGSNKILYQNKRHDLEMAPNSNFNYGVDLNSHSLTVGRYNILLHVSSNKGHWRLSKDFVMTRKMVAKYNDQAVELPRNNNWWLYAIFVVMIAIILFLIIRLR
ncbi:DUF916 and DUF3324 domain-containing protein [Latilactobacillus graminis]|uniref:DUF3324 domain-containing protein n=2 Tax=Latilactobacillus graminis TaxID=60519 RepID=A0AA89I270_9LACO|nr:DUF916 and DUF3324 domain-containing protein [Latilactobacillus graminis]KRM24139.1 hypothetical protein FC90_GL000614 [Latilactobacillus graminis DSM 20719]QFP78874.1 DUF916 and DUF3324 domain-containing protein [Latilactobacillus graminis]